MALKVGELYADASLNTGGFTRGISTLLGSVRGFSKKAGLLLGGVTAAVGGLAIAMGGKAVGSAATFQKAMADVEAAADTSEEGMAALEEKAKELGKSSKFMMADIAGAERALAKSGYTAEQTVAAMDGVVDAAAASGEPLERVGVQITNVVKGFDAAASETGRFADVFAEAARSSNVSINSLAEGMKYVGPITSDMLKEMNMSAEQAKEEFGKLDFTAKEMGMSVERAAAMMGTLGDAGIEAGQAGRQLRSAFLRYQKIQAGVITDKQAGLMQQLAAQTLGSTKAANNWIKTVENGKVSFTDFISTLREGGATAGELSKLFGQNASTAVVKLADNSEELDVLTKRLQGSEGAAREMAQIKLDTLSGQFDVLKGSIDNMFQSLGEKLLPKLQSFLQDIVIPIVNKMTNWIDKQGSLNDLFEKLSDFLGQETMKDLKQAGKNFANFFSTLKDVLGPTMKKMLPVVKNLFQILADLMAGDFGGAGQNIKEYLQSIGDVVGTLFKEIVEHTGLSKLVEKIQNVIKIIENLIKKIPDVGGAAKKFGGQVAGFFGFGGGDKNLQTLIKDWTSKGFGQSKFVAPGDVSSLKKYIQEMNMGVEEQRKTIVTLLAKVAQNIKDPKEQAKQLGVAIERLKKKINTVDLSKLNPKDFIGEFGKLDLTLPQLGMERAKLIGQLDTALAGKLQSDISTETRADFTIAESVTVEERQDIEELNRMIQRTYDQWLRQVKGEK